MSRKQLFRQSNNQTVADIFERFVASQTAKEVSDKTIQNYHSHLHSLQKHLDFSAPLATLTKEDLDNMVISMRQSGLAHNSISSYLRVFRTFLNWARKAGYTELEMENYKDKETVKETYSDAELSVLLKKPDIRKATFAEYRDWVIINFLLNCGCRAATVRAIQIRDVDLSTGIDADWLNKPDEAGAIVFCPHRQGSLGVYDTVINRGASSALAAAYGGEFVSSFVGGDVLSGQDRFIKGETSVMVATKAFGMGIDKPNVRFTVNINHSGSLEAFVQEAGRAGRDRKMAVATIL